MAGALSGPNVSFDCRIVDIREIDGERLLASQQVGDNVIAVLAHVQDQRATVRHILGRIAAAEAAERDRALTGLLLLAGLRKLEEVIEREASQMPLLDDIMDNKVLGPKIRKAQEQAREVGRDQGWEQGLHDGESAVLLRLIEKRFGGVNAAGTAGQNVHC
jgi:hypothetical protein